MTTITTIFNSNMQVTNVLEDGVSIPVVNQSLQLHVKSLLKKGLHPSQFEVVDEDDLRISWINGKTNVIFVFFTPATKQISNIVEMTGDPRITDYVKSLVDLHTYEVFPSLSSHMWQIQRQIDGANQCVSIHTQPN